MSNPLPENIISHKRAWRNILWDAYEKAYYSQVEEDTSYLKHELNAYDDMHKDLDSFRNVRIDIGYLTRACIALGEVHVVAAGTYYATLRLRPTELETLTKNNISWMFD